MRPDAHTLVAAYAVDALDQAERDDVRAHLQECSVCRDDLRGYRETVAALAAADAEPPPARLREQVLSRVRTTPQLPPLTPDETVDDTAVTSEATRAAPAGASPSAGAGRRRAPGRALFALAAGVLTVVALGAGVWGFDASQRLADVRAQQAVVQQVLSADDVVSVSGRPQLTGTVHGDDVVVLASAAADAALLLPAGLPEAPEGSTWQAWAVTGQDAVSAGVFDASGGEALVLDSGVVGVDAVAVTLEPAGGSEAPSSDPVLVVPLL